MLRRLRDGAIASPSPGKPSSAFGLPWVLPCAPALSPCSARLRTSCCHAAATRNARLHSDSGWYARALPAPLALAPLHPRCSLRLRTSCCHATPAHDAPLPYPLCPFGTSPPDRGSRPSDSERKQQTQFAWFAFLAPLQARCSRRLRTSS